ncbi:MAG: hypothetical protein WEB04_12745 [Dehalococcoidia bacterium]
MRIACVLVPSFAVAVERRSDPCLAGQPVVVYDRHGVIDADAAGVRRGQTLRSAKGQAPGAMFLQADYARYRVVSDAMLDALEHVAPFVEEAGLGCAYADAGGLQGHYNDELALAGALIEAVRDATGLLASAGIASGKFVAWVAGACVEPGEAGSVPAGREREFLRDKDIALLPYGPEIVQRLDLLALRTLGDVAALPRASVEAQFRRDGRRLWELASGTDRELLRPRTRQELLVERLSFESGVVATEALVAAGRQIVTRLTGRLKGRTARRMHVQLLADGRIVWERLETFREPSGDDRTMLLLIKTRLSLLELPQPIDTVVVTLSGIGREIAKQTKLFTDSQQNLDQIAEAIRQLRARYGRPVVWRIEEVDPWSRHPEERRVLVPYDA